MSKRKDEGNENVPGLFDNGYLPQAESVSDDTVLTKERGLDYIKFQATDYQIHRAGSWKSLFEGFSHLKVITFSSSISMLMQVIRLFKNVEVILGNEAVIGDLEEFIRYQYASMAALKEENSKTRNYLVNRINDKTLSFYVTRLGGFTSHQKIYLLSDGDPDEESKEEDFEEGRVRVITGSANLTRKAFGASQLETLFVSDDFRTYDLFRRTYEKTRAVSSARLSSAMIQKIGIDQLQELPAIKEVVEAKQILVEDPGHVDQYAISVGEFKKFAKENHLDINKELTQKVKGNDTVSVVTYRTVNRFLKKVENLADERKQKYDSYPSLRVDKVTGKVYLNDEAIDLDNIDQADVDRDVEVFQEFFAGYEDKAIHCKGSRENIVKKYYATANYAFCAPFLSVCRQETVGTDIGLIPYPMFLLLRGESNGGKTFMMKFLLHLLFNPYGLNIDYEHGLIQNAKQDGNAPRGIDQRRLLMQGMPIMLDEVEQDRWRGYATRFIKMDIPDRHNISPIIMATNKVPDIEKALAKRTITFNIDMSVPIISNLTRKTALATMNKATGALYREYLRRMMKKLPAFLHSFHDETSKTVPDVLKLSSEILASIFQEYAERHHQTIPFYVDTYDMVFYLVNANKADNIAYFINLYYKTGYLNWMINRKEDYIRIPFEHGYDAKNFQNRYGLELTEVQGADIIMPLKKSEKFFGIKMGKRSLWDRIRGK